MKVHIVGAGPAGLAAALTCIRAGATPVLYEAASSAGGRCRSIYSPILEQRIDNGTHLILGANRQTLAFLKASGGLAHMYRGQARYPFFELATGNITTLTHSHWPGGIGQLARALMPGHGQTVAGRMGRCHPLWASLTAAIMNTDMQQADHDTFASCLRTAALTIGGLRPWLPTATLQDALITPAVQTIERHGIKIYFNHVLQYVDSHILTFKDKSVSRKNDQVILALPPWSLHHLEKVAHHFATRSILNLHLRLPYSPLLPGGCRYLGLTGGMAQFLRIHGNVACVTISAADIWQDHPRQDVVDHIWAETAPVLTMPGAPLPPHHLVWIKQATILQSPDQMALRPKANQQDFILAGDWMCSGLPSTIEAAIRSGISAAQVALNAPRLSLG